MKRRLIALAIVLTIILVGVSTHPGYAASPGDFIKFTYVGGGVCLTNYVSVPVLLQVSRAKPERYTTVVSLNGVTFGSYTGTDSAGSFAGSVNYGSWFGTAQTLPYTYQWKTTYQDDSFTINAVCSSVGGEPVVSIASIPTTGPTRPGDFVLKTITCTVAVYDGPAGAPVGDNVITSGQTWYVNPTFVAGDDGQDWAEVFVSGYVNGFIPARCVQ